MADFRALRKPSSCFRITFIFCMRTDLELMKRISWTVFRNSNFRTVWNWPNMHPEQILFLLPVSVPSCCPTWFRLCTHLLLVITSSPSIPYHFSSSCYEKVVQTYVLLTFEIILSHFSDCLQTFQIISISDCTDE